MGDFLWVLHAVDSDPYNGRGDRWSLQPRDYDGVNVQDFGAVGNWNGSTGSDDTQAIKDARTHAVNKSSTGGKLIFPPTSLMYQWNDPNPLINRSGLTVQGANRQTCRIAVTQGSLIDPTLSGNLADIAVRDLGLYASGAHLINIGANDLIQSDFERVRFFTSANGLSFFNQANAVGNFLENRIMQCEFDRPAASTVPAISLVNSFGAVNGNLFSRLRMYGHLGSNAPAIKIEGTSSSTYLFDNTFERIVGEQNLGGLLHCYTVNGLYISQVADFDGGTYLDHVIKVSTSSLSTLTSRNININEAGRFSGALGSGIFDIWMPTGTTPPFPQPTFLYNPTVFPGTPKIQAPLFRSMIIGDNGVDTSMIRVGQSDCIGVGHATTGNRPSASGVGAGAMFFDDTLHYLITSDGTNWRNGAGTIV